MGRQQSDVVVPYGQFLVGIVRRDLSVLDVNESAVDFGIQPGGGVEIGGRPIGAHIEASWRRIFDESDSGATNELRLVFGVVIRSGW